MPYSVWVEGFKNTVITMHVMYSTIQPYLEFGNENFHLTHKKILDDDGFFEKA